MKLRATQPQLVSQDTAVLVELLLQGNVVWSTHIHASGWLQLLIVPDSRIQMPTLDPVMKSCDTVRLTALDDVATCSIESGYVEAFGVYRSPVAFSDVEFCYLAIAARTDLVGPILPVDLLRHISTDALGFILVRREPMNAYALKSGGSLLERFTTTEDGNELMEAGVVFPVLGIHAWTYRILVTDGPLIDPQLWAGPKVASRGPYNCGADGSLEVMLAQGLEDWPGASRLIDVELGWFYVDIHASGPHGVGVGTYVLRCCEAPGIQADEPLINQDPGMLFEQEIGDSGDGNWIHC